MVSGSLYRRASGNLSPLFSLYLWHWARRSISRPPLSLKFKILPNKEEGPRSRRCLGWMSATYGQCACFFPSTLSLAINGHFKVGAFGGVVFGRFRNSSQPPNAPPSTALSSASIGLSEVQGTRTLSEEASLRGQLYDISPCLPTLTPPFAIRRASSRECHHWHFERKWKRSMEFEKRYIGFNELGKIIDRLSTA